MLKLPTEDEASDRIAYIRSLVAKPFIRGSLDPQPAILTGGVLLGSKYHAADVTNLQKLGVTAVLNCASGGISRLPVDELEDRGIRYAFTNVRLDDYQYPILHDPINGQPSQHLQVARQLYEDVVRNNGGKILFFCVAGMNRSTCLGVAALMLFGHSLDQAMRECAIQRPFVLENQGFQLQLVQLEAILRQHPDHAAPPSLPQSLKRKSSSYYDRESALIEIELLIPGLCTMEVKIPVECTIDIVKRCLVDHANRDLLSYKAEISDKGNSSDEVIAKSWLVLAMFGYDSMYDVPLEVEALDTRTQLNRIQSMFNLEVRREGGEHFITWTTKCRFALVIFSVRPRPTDEDVTFGPISHEKQISMSSDKTLLHEDQRPWTFLHEERPGVPATFLENNLLSTHLRAWDLVTGQAYASEQAIVFSYSHDEHDRQAFMWISTQSGVPQRFHAPGEGNILGMGANSIVHRVKLQPTSLASPHKRTSRHTTVITTTPSTTTPNLSDDESEVEELSKHQVGWDAAVKRPYSMLKMLASLDRSSEAGMAKRMRLANKLNSDGRILYVYGLGVAMSANADTIAQNTNHTSALPTPPSSSRNSKVEYKWEAILLARYEEEFSTYTMKRFMEDYIVMPKWADPNRAQEIRALQAKFTLIHVKILLVSLLNAFRDLTLMGIQAFDFNHLGNVLVSRDHRTVRLIDIDGNSKGSIQYPSEYIRGSTKESRRIHRPSLDVDLNAVLPTVIQQLLLGKGRGNAFVVDMKSEIWRRSEEDSKALIREILWENFYAGTDEDPTRAERHIAHVAEWFHAILKKGPPWMNWTNDIYDAMRAIDHLPVS